LYVHCDIRRLPCCLFLIRTVRADRQAGQVDPLLAARDEGVEGADDIVAVDREERRDHDGPRSQPQRGGRGRTAGYSSQCAVAIRSTVARRAGPEVRAVESMLLMRRPPGFGWV
jgi:hypothetical protein